MPSYKLYCDRIMMQYQLMFGIFGSSTVLVFHKQVLVDENDIISS